MTPFEMYVNYCSADADIMFELLKDYETVVTEEPENTEQE